MVGPGAQGRPSKPGLWTPTCVTPHYLCAPASAPLALGPGRQRPPRVRLLTRAAPAPSPCAALSLYDLDQWDSVWDVTTDTHCVIGGALQLPVGSGDGAAMERLLGAVATLVV